jgi:hypothetical protein
MPAKVQKRRTVSFRPSVYARAKAHAASLGLSLAGWMELVAADALDEAGAPHVTAEPHAPKRNGAGIRNHPPARMDF